MEVGECKSVHIMQCNTQSSSNAWGKKQAGQQGGNEGQETRVKFGEELIAARWCFLVRALLRPLFARNFLLKVCSQLQCQFYGRHIIVDLPCFLSAWQPRLKREEVARKRSVGRGRQLYFGCAGFHQHRWRFHEIQIHLYYMANFDQHHMNLQIQTKVRPYSGRYFSWTQCSFFELPFVMIINVETEVLLVPK